MDRLPHEIWGLVAGQIYAAKGTKDLLALCLVCRHFHEIASACLYRSLFLDNGKNRLRLLAKRMTKRTACHVRECECESSLPNSCGLEDSQVEMLQSVIQRLPALRRFKWNCFTPIPDSLVEELNQIPSLRELDISYKVDLGSRHVLSSPALNGNMKFVTLALCIIRETRREGDLDLHECTKLISQAPGLKSLIISFRKPKSPHNQAHSKILTFSPDEILPPLESLVLQNYDLGRGGPNVIENRLDVAKLRTLDLRYVGLDGLSVFIKALLSTRQINLMHFKIQADINDSREELDCWHSTLDEFLESFAGLESLVLYGDCASKLPSLSAIIKHGETLQQLKVHSGMTTLSLLENPELGIPPDNLQAIGDSCPHLCELEIDLDRAVQNNKSLDPIRQSLRNFKSLREIEVNFPDSSGYHLSSNRFKITSSGWKKIF